MKFKIWELFWRLDLKHVRSQGKEKHQEEEDVHQGGGMGPGSVSETALLVGGWPGIVCIQEFHDPSQLWVPWGHLSMIWLQFHLCMLVYQVLWQSFMHGWALSQDEIASLNSADNEEEQLQIQLVVGWRRWQEKCAIIVHCWCERRTHVRELKRPCDLDSFRRRVSCSTSTSRNSTYCRIL